MTENAPPGHTTFGERIRRLVCDGVPERALRLQVLAELARRSVSHRFLQYAALDHGTTFLADRSTEWRTAAYRSELSLRQLCLADVRRLAG